MADAALNIFNSSLTHPGAINLVVFGILGGSKTHWWWTIALGVLYAPIYYYGFRLVITRMRVRVKEMKEVVDQTLMTTGANGVNRVSEHDVQVIYGPQVEKIANEVKNALGVA